MDFHLVRLVLVGSVFVYGCSAINIPIGLICGVYYACRCQFITDEMRKKEYARLSCAWFYSMIPVVGPFWGVDRVTNF